MRKVTLLVVVLVLMFAVCGVIVQSGRVCAQTSVSSTTAQPVVLTEAERTGLLFMREEEKLAYDVYLALYKKLGHRMFNNIAWSEGRHMERVRMLLDVYGVPGPVAGKKAGEYRDPELQKLYGELVERGSKSVVAALQVGAEIEDMDIADLTRRIEQTNKLDLRTVYGNLRRASGNHLRAFVRQLDWNGVTYKPQHLSQREYKQILSEGQGRRMGRRGR